MTALATTLTELAAVIQSRAGGDAASSYTAQLLADADNGGERLLKKIIEEAGEVSLAAAFQGRERVVDELADLWFHCLVLMRRHDISLDDLAAALAKRRGMSGLEEKAKRAANSANKET